MFTYVITEPPGPPKRMFYDEILDPLERNRIYMSLTDKQKAYQQAAYELFVTEIDYANDMRTLINVHPI